jgi:glucokinase
MISRILQLLFIDIMAVGLSVDAHNGREGDGDVEQRRLLISHLDS